ncbi:MAG: fasciclin domain-containing protein, partial [Longimicrobiales bacterium]|nr:fasciclin domain-containing protein [Longimicrobiales bacterium]
LAYHVVPGAFTAAEVLASSTLATVNGADAVISLDSDGNPRIDDAIIIATDIGARNGIVHVIDRVIFPN